MEGFEVITTEDDAGDMHPDELVTVKVYVPEGMSVTVALAPDPGLVIPPGVLVKVQLPEAGNPFSITLPVPTVQVG